jgi:hypothetical protein
MSPESPKTVWLPTAWRRCTSLNRAREPYDVGGMIGSGGGENTPITHPGCLRHHNAVLVFDCENAGSRNNGLSARIGSANRWVGDGLDGLGVLDPVSKGVFDNVGLLVDRICSVGIKAIVPLRMVQSAPGSQN